MRSWRPQLPTQEQLNIDETATKEENGKAWLWTFVARMFTVFAVRATREATALDVFLGETFQRHRHLRSGQDVLASRALAVVLGASETRFSSDDRQRRPAGEMAWSTTCGRRRASCSSIGPTIAPAGFRGRRLCVGWGRSAARWSACCCAACKAETNAARHVPGIVRASPVAVDVSASRRGRADEQRGRAVVASCGDLAEALVWNAKCQRQPLRRDDADGDRNLPPAAPQRLRLSHRAVEAHLAHQPAPSLLPRV